MSRQSRSRFLRAAFRWVAGLLLVVGGVIGASAQTTERPGGMQSGQRVPTGAPNKEAGAGAQPSPAAPSTASLDVNQLFATSCGWCHLKGGREVGKGPKLMGTSLTDGEIVTRIKQGKMGQMPAFGSMFSDDQLRTIVVYIRGLKP